MPTKPPVHRPLGQQTRQQYDQARAPEHAKVYDYKWRKLSKQFLLVNPLCVDCTDEGIVGLATETDHIIPITQAPDRRLDWSNLAPRCKHHHSQKTAREVWGKG
jgi:5-methylcytosine-specific restriction enzyme A